MRAYLQAARDKYRNGLRDALAKWDAEKLEAQKLYKAAYTHYTVKQLKTLAKRHGLNGYSKLKKADLINLFAECNEFTMAANNNYSERAYEAAYEMNQASEYVKNHG